MILSIVSVAVFLFVIYRLSTGEQEEEDYIFEECMKPVRKFRLKNDYYFNNLKKKTIRGVNEKKG